jgi:hypothetical protein
VIDELAFSSVTPTGEFQSTPSAAAFPSVTSARSPLTAWDADGFFPARRFSVPHDAAAADSEGNVRSEASARIATREVRGMVFMDPGYHGPGRRAIG